MMKLAKTVFCSVLLLIIIPLVQADSTPLQLVQQTCQCPSCDLQGVNLAGFKPASMSPQENPLLKAKSKSADPLASYSCNLSHANLSRANLNDTNFRAYFIRAPDTALATTNFSAANLSKATLQRAILVKGNFTDVNFSGADLQAADLSWGVFQHADFSNANLSRVVAVEDNMNGFGADMRSANFTHANLRDANIYADFSGANFAYADLSNAHLSTSESAVPDVAAKKTNLWQKVNFYAANLQGAVLRGDYQAALFCKTIMPDGQINNRDCS